MAQRERRNYKTAEREEREKRRKWRKERRERAKEDETWSLAQWLMAGFGILCCREVSHGSKEHISDAKRRKEKERRARRKEGKQRDRAGGDDRRHQRHPKDVEDLGRVKGAPDEVEMEHNADFLRRRSSSRLLDDDSEYSGESARSGLSRASSFASSYASYVSTQSAEPRRRRSQGSRRGSKGREGPGEAAPSTVKVLNLADLRGRELPAKLEDLQKVPMDPALARTSVKNGAPAANGSSSHRQPAKPSPPPVEVPPREEQEEVQAPLSARSGRSEGAGSVKSVASTSIQRYSDQLSGPKKSSADIKKMVKEFVREMVKGKEMNVLRVDGSLMEVKCGLTRTLDALKIKSGGETRNLRLGDVEKVLHGAPAELNDLSTPLDDACATLLLLEECISFKFADAKKAELFTLCMNLFIDGLRKGKWADRKSVV